MLSYHQDQEITDTENFGKNSIFEETFEENQEKTFFEQNEFPIVKVSQIQASKESPTKKVILFFKFAYCN